MPNTIPTVDPAWPRWFATTHWTVVLNARSSDPAKAKDALEELCRSSWAPVNSYIRRRGYCPADADDLTQQFFARFIEKAHYQLADPQRGRFRSFLLTSVRNFLVDQRERARARKRGGGATLVSIDEVLEEHHSIPAELVDEQDAQQVYEQKWAMTLLAKVRRRLTEEFSSEGKAQKFSQLEQFLPGQEGNLTYAEAAAQLGVPEGTIKSDVHRLKRRYGQLLREEIANTVGAAEEVEAEWRYLISVLGRQSSNDSVPAP